MNWTDLKITVSTKDTETAEAIAQMAVPYGIYIEDYSDMLELVPQIAHIDLIDEDPAGPQPHRSDPAPVPAPRRKIQPKPPPSLPTGWKQRAFPIASRPTKRWPRRTGPMPGSVFITPPTWVNGWWYAPAGRNTPPPRKNW